MQIAANNNFFNMGKISNSSDLGNLTGFHFAQAYIAKLLYQARESDQVELLITLAHHACAKRQFDLLESVGELLLRMTDNRAGEYYLALVAKNKGFTEESEALLNKVVESGDRRFRAKGVKLLGSIYFQKSQLEEALRCEIITLGIAGGNDFCDPTAFIEAQQAIAILKSIDGDHHGAIAHLERLFPLVRLSGQKQPFLYYQFLNSLAVEFGEVGRMSEARGALNICLASNYANAYPEWHETRQELDEKSRGASRSVVTFSEGVIKNVVRIDTRQNDQIPYQPLVDSPRPVTNFNEWKRSEMAVKENQKKTDPVSREDKKTVILRRLINDDLSDDQIDAMYENAISDDQENATK